ncbi:MAG: type IIL restriction-modification enzyme MmeI, partial [Paludibacter sp.]
MNIGQINTNLENLILNFNPETFIYDLLLAYGTPKATIARAQLSDKNLFDEFGSDMIIRKKVFYRAVEPTVLQSTFTELRTSDKVRRQEPRFIIVTDFESLLAVDTKTTEVLDIPLVDVNRHFDFFLPWAGMEKHKIAQEQEADLKAADRMAKLYDEICKTNPTETPEQVHNLNVFLSRLLFCFFAEDTDIFEKNLFT